MTLNDTLDQIDLVEIHRTFHPEATEYTFFASSYGAFSRIDHVLPQNKSYKPYRIILLRGLWMVSYKETGHQKDQTMMTSCHSQLHPSPTLQKKGQGLETELVIDYAYRRKPP